jgi:glycosyltransferase involved in cell wall biosynthesis
MDLSIVITSFNYESYLKDCIDSCIFQDVCNLEYEIIVVDDGSTDDTNKILNQSFPLNLKVYRIENSGIEQASNYGFLKSRGEYIVRVDADDILLPNYLTFMEQYINERHSFIYSDYQIINNKNKVIKSVELPDFDREEIQKRGDFLATGTIVKSKLIKQLNGYNTDVINSGLENYEFILKLIHLDVIGLHVPRILFGYRRHGHNISDIKKEKIIQHGKDLFQQNHFGKFQTNEFHPYGLKI